MRNLLYTLIIPFVFSSCYLVNESFDHIVVTATGDVTVVEYDEEKQVWGERLIGEAVELSLIKDGGQRIDEIGTTGAFGTTSITGIFDLYKDQPIDFKAKLVSNPFVFGSDRVTWELVEARRTPGGRNQPDDCSVELHITLRVPF